jgi:hypothetical protein
MKTRLQFALAVLLIVVAIPCAFLLWMARDWPAQPATRTVAKVVAISPSVHRFHPNDEYVVVRNAHATGEFTVDIRDAKCRVGDEVVVKQRGTTLGKLPSICR